MSGENEWCDYTQKEPPKTVIRSDKEDGFWNNGIGWVEKARDATVFDGPPTSLPSIDVPDCKVMEVTKVPNNWW